MDVKAATENSAKAAVPRSETRPKARRPLPTLSVIVFQEGEWLCARCLQHDLVAQAKALPALYARLHRMIVGHIAVRYAHGQQPFNDLPRAPQKYWEMYQRSKIILPPQMFRFNVKNRTLRVPTPKVRIAA